MWEEYSPYPALRVDEQTVVIQRGRGRGEVQQNSDLCRTSGVDCGDLAALREGEGERSGAEQ